MGATDEAELFEGLHLAFPVGRSDLADVLFDSPFECLPLLRRIAIPEGLGMVHGWLVVNHEEHWVEVRAGLSLLGVDENRKGKECQKSEGSWGASRSWGGLATIHSSSLQHGLMRLSPIDSNGEALSFVRLT